MGRPLIHELRKREEIEVDVNKKIRYTAEIAYNHSPFYHEKFDQLGLKPADIKDKKSLSKAIHNGLRLTKQELIGRFNDVVTDFSKDQFVAELWSSGSTGVPKRVWYGVDDFRRSYEQVEPIYNALGLSRGDYVLNMFSPSPNASGPLSVRAADDFGLHTLKMSVPIKGDRLGQIIKRSKPKSVFALSTRANQLPDEIANVGGDVSKYDVDSILTGGEPYTMEKRKRIEEKWGDAAVLDVLASCECSVWGYMSKECDPQVLHVAENRILLDSVDDGFESVADGEKGTDVITTLSNEGEKPATVILGYQHGDGITPLDYDCACGRTYQAISWPIQRNDNIAVVAGQNLDPMLGTEEAIMKYPEFTGEYVSMFQSFTPDTKSKLDIRVETKGFLSDEKKNAVQDEILQKVVSNPAAEGMVITHADFDVQFMEVGHLFDGWEKYQKPGKPVRLIKP